jgi:FAD/FMN-containing dehydrogenase
LAAELSRLVGDRHVLVDADLCAPYEVDWTRRYRGRARLVVRPASTGEVVDVVGACRRAGAAVVVQGGNTGLVGGGVPRGGEVVLSTTRLVDVGPVDDRAGQLTVGAGVTLARAQAAAGSAGWEVGVDLGARDSATVGGMVATNAGGVHVVAHGHMRARLAGIEAVLADGSVVSRLAGLAKDTAGYDLPGLLCGSEGTLGVVTQVVLRLVPRPSARVTAVLGTSGTAAALAVVTRLRRSLAGFEAAEVVYADGVRLVGRQLGVPSPLPGEPPCLLLVEAAAFGAAGPRLMDDMAAAVAGCPEVLETAVATDEFTRAALWAVRERHTEMVSTLGIPHKLDVSVPVGCLADFEADVRTEVGRVAPGAILVLFGHAGDGNLHVNVVGPEPADDRVDGAVLGLVARYGGSVSAEHGIGVAKVRWLDLTRSAAEIAAMRSVKRALDPTGMLNPGVLLPAVGASD